MKNKKTEKQISEESKENKQKSESELEKEIEETESQEASEVLEKTSEETIDDNEFREFIQPSTESFAPVLEKVEIPQQESLEQDVASTSVSSKADKGQIDYSTTSNEPKYSAEEIKYQTNIEPPILKPAEISRNLPRQEFLEPVTEVEISPQNMMSPKMVDTEFIEEKTRLPFERDDKKYKEFKL